MRIPSLFVFKLGLLLVSKLSRLLAVDARNVTVDNTSPLVVYSPSPCDLVNTTDCTTEWVLSPSPDAFNGSTTSTTGRNPDQSPAVPRASLTFQGSSVLFVPGQTSTAIATIVVDNLTSIQLDTSLDQFLCIDLDPSSDHTISITFVPGDQPTTLEIDYFVIEEPDQIVNVTSSATPTLEPTFAPTPLPTTLPSSPTLSTTSNTSTTTPLPTNTNTTISTTHTPPGTIAALSLSALAITLFALLTWLFALRRRRRRTALQREKAILYDLRLPSERGGGGGGVGVGKDERGAGIVGSGKDAELGLGDGAAGAGVAKEAGDLERQLQAFERTGHNLQGNPAVTPWQEPHSTQVLPTSTDDVQQQQQQQPTHGQRREKGKARERSWAWRESILPPVHYTRWR